MRSTSVVAKSCAPPPTSRRRLWKASPSRFTAKTGSADRLYGSITAADVAQAIASTLSVTVDKRNVQLNDPIKALGTFSVPVKLHRDVTVPVTVEVVKASA